MKKIFILLIVLLGLLVIGCGKKWDYQVTKKESIQIGNDITFYLLTLKEKESGNEIEPLQITKEGFDKYNVEDKLTKEELDSIKISEDSLVNSDLTLKGNYCIVENTSSTDLKNIKGLELSKRYFYDIVLPEFEKTLFDILPLCAFGLVGEGSECYGYDDELSKDHDFGPSVCIWLRKDDYLKYKDRINEALKNLPKTYLGFQELKESEWGYNRRGLLNIEDFYFKFIGSANSPQTINDWQKIPENALATVTNGEVFLDNLGEFTKIREQLLNYYPEAIRQNKIATRLMNISQHGQYNYVRCLRRNDLVAANQCLYLFVDEVIHLVFLLNRRYKIFYKWANRALLDLKILGNEIHKLLEDMVFAQNKIPYVRKICKVLADELRNQKLTDCKSKFLGDLGVDIQKNINDKFFKNYSPWLD